MVLESLRPYSEKWLTPVAMRLSRFSPNSITFISLVLALFAGIFIYISIDILLIPAGICVFLSGFLDVLDGKLARIKNQASKGGDFLDHAVDRVADILIIGGIGLSNYAEGSIASAALVAVLMASYMGTQAQAVGMGRDYKGILSRADRIAILTFLPMVHYFIISFNISMPIIAGRAYTIIDYVMLWFVIAGFWTAGYRGITTWNALKQSED